MDGGVVFRNCGLGGLLESSYDSWARNDMCVCDLGPESNAVVA